MYSNKYDSTKTHYIMISKNIKNNENNENNGNNGIKINIKGYIPSELYNNNYTTLNNYDEKKLKNRIIFCANINNNIVRPIILLTQQNINHNIKLIYKKIENTNINDLTNPRIIFKKYSIDENDVKYENKKLFSTNSDNTTLLNSIYYQNKFMNIDNEDSYINSSNVNNENYRTKKLIIGYNIYNPYKNSNFYKINFQNFINKKYITNRNYDNVNDNIEATITRLSNLNNYNEFQNTQLLYQNQSNNMTNSSNNRALYNNIYHEQLYYFIDNSENQLTLLNKNFYLQEKDLNFLIYNKEKNLKNINIKFRYYNNYSKNYEATNNYNDISVYFFIKRYKYFTDNFYKKKIILNKNFTYLSSKIINSDSNFYNNNNINYKNKVYLSFGYNIFGLTKYNLFNNFKLTNDKIFITNKTKLVVTGETYDYLYNADYLLDINDNYDYNYYHIYANNQFILSNKELKYNRQIFNNIINFNNYINVYNNYYIINNNNTKLLTNRNSFNESYNITNSFLYTETEDDIIYNKDIFYLQFDNNFDRIKSNKNFISLDSETNNNIINFNFKNNYDVTFYAYFKLNLKDQYSNIILNENKFNLSLKIQALPGSNFKNVNCVFIYHNPNTTTDPSYLYPNDNVQVIIEPSIDTISKAIELLPVSNRANKNTTIIPNRNASNLSKKQIQGLIGLNNIPKLLSIQPYDESFIIGRGFLNQYRVENDCSNDTDKVKLKLNSQKHNSVKNNTHLSSDTKVKKNKFYNLVNNRALNKNIKAACTNTSNNPQNITNYYTPMKMFRTNKGIYLPSGK